MEVQNIIEGGITLARHIPSEVAWKEPLAFFSGEDEFVQVGTWNYESGKKLMAHRHNLVPRTVDWTQEVLYVRSGRIRASVYDGNEKLITTLEAGPGDILILLNGGHGYEILEDGSQVLEVKNGPYLGPEVDRRRF